MLPKNKFYCLLLFFSFTLSYSQQEKITAIQVLKKATAAYNKQEYISYNSNYSLYLDYSSQKVYEQYSGIILKKNNVNYFKIKDTEFISFNDYVLKISSEQKAIVMENGSKAIEESPLSLNNYLKGFDAKLTRNKDYFICELIPAKLSQIMFSKVIIYIKQTDYSISKQTLFFVEKMESKNAKGKIIYSIPRLEITFNSRPKNEQKDNFLTLKENYFTEKNTQIKVSKRFSAYQLFKS